ncbi:hypothetical protein GPALN_003364 [Globodera pallida]|nr:hypothetical protein GPALN_003364 [Globodera pallida]
MVLNVDQLVLLRRFVSANVLRDCINLRLIASPGQALAKWLHTPLKDGRLKVFNLDSMSHNGDDINDPHPILCADARSMIGTKSNGQNGTLSQ